MHTDESILPGSRKIKLAAVGIPCLLVLYVLSIGPIAKMDDAGYFSDRATPVLGVLYAPVLFPASAPGINQVFNWYLYDVWNCDRMTTL